MAGNFFTDEEVRAIDAEAEAYLETQKSATVETADDVAVDDPNFAQHIDTLAAKQENSSPIHGYFQMFGNYTNRVKEFLGAEYRLGNEGVVGRGTLGFHGMWESIQGRSDEPYIQQGNTAEMQKLQEMVQNTRDTGELELKLGDRYIPLVNMLGSATNQLPYMIEMGKNSLIGGALGAGAGFVLGGPAGAAKGGELGIKAGPTYTAVSVETGNSYQDLRQAGAAPEKARVIASTVGAISGTLEMIGVGQLVKFTGGRFGAGKAIASRITEALTEKEGETFIRGLLKTIGVEEATENLQEASQVLGEWAGAIWDDNAQLWANLQPEQLKERFMQVIQQTLEGTLTLGLLGGGAGHVAGKTTGTITEAIKAGRERYAAQQAEQQTQQGTGVRSTAKPIELGIEFLDSAARQIQEGIAPAPPTEEQIAAVEQTTVADALDALAKPLFDEQGDIIQENVVSEASPTSQEVVAQPEDGAFNHLTEADFKEVESRVENTNGTVVREIDRYLKILKQNKELIAEGRSGRDVNKAKLRLNTALSELQQKMRELSEKAAANKSLDGEHIRPEDAAFADYISKRTLDIAKHLERLREAVSSEGASENVVDFKSGLPNIQMPLNRYENVAQGSKTEPITVYRGQIDTSAKATDVNIHGMRSISDFIPSAKGLDYNPTPVGLEFYTESSTDAAMYANQDEALLKRLAGDVDKFEILAGRQPQKGAVKTFQIQPKKVLDLTDLGPTAQYHTLIARLLREDGEAPPTGPYDPVVYAGEDRVDAAFGISKKTSEDGEDFDVYKLLRNVKEAPESANAFVQWAKEHGYDAIKYSHANANHYALITDAKPKITPVEDVIDAGQVAKEKAKAQKAELKTTRQEIEALRKQTKLVKKGQRPVSKFDADTQAQLTKLDQLIASPEARQQAYENYQQNPTPENEADMLSAMLAEGHEDKTHSVKQAKELRDALKAAVEGGLSKAQKMAEQRQQEQKARIEKGIAEINGSQPYTDKLRAGKKQGKPDTPVVAPFYNWSDFLKHMSQHSKSDWLVREFDHRPALNKYLELHSDLQEKVATTMAKAFKDRSISKRELRRFKQKMFTDAVVSKKPLGVSMLSDGTVKEFYMSRGEAIKLWMEFQAAKVDENVQRGFREGNKYTFQGDKVAQGAMTTEEMVDQILTPQEKNLAETELQIYRDLYDEILNPFWRKEFGVDLPQVLSYSPILREQFDQSESNPFAISIAPSATKSRTENALSIAYADHAAVLAQYIDAAARFVAFDPYKRKTEAFFNDGQVKTLIQKKYGNNFYTIMRDQMEAVVTNRNKYNTAAFRLVNDFRRRVATMMVSGKLASIPKQATAIFTALDRLGPVEFARTVAYVTAHPVKVTKTLEKSATYRTLVAANEPTLAEVVNSERDVFGVENQLLHLVFAPVRLGVRIGTLGGYGVYQQAIKAGKSEDAALREVDRYLSETQQSPFLADQSAWERHPASRMFTLFGGDPIQASRQIFHAMQDVKNFPKDEASWRNLVKKVIVFHLLVPTAFTAMGAALDGEWDDDDTAKTIRAALFGPWGQVPILGDALQMLGTVVQNELFHRKEKVWELKTPILQVLQSGFDTLKNVAEYMTGADVEMNTFLVNLAKASPILPAPVGGLPWPEVLKWLGIKKEPKKKRKKVELL